MNISIKLSPEFINTIAEAKSKTAIKKNVLRSILYKRSNIRFYGNKCLGISEDSKIKIVLRYLDEIKELKQQLKLI